MLNNVILEGYVMFLEQIKGGVSFKLSVHRGKKPRMQDRSFLMPCIVYGEDIFFNDRDHVVLYGRLDGHAFRGRRQLEVIVQAKHVRLITPPSREMAYPKGFPLPPTGGEYDEGEEDSEEEGIDEPY